MQANENVYQSLAKSVFWNVDSSLVNFANAQNLYEYALYEYNHNKTVQDSLSLSTLDQLHSLASAQQWAFNTQEGGNAIGTIAGRTFASKVFQQLSHNVASEGLSNKLTLMFGSYQPFLSFFDLSGLSTGPSAPIFKTLPAHGSMMAFELFSYAPGNLEENATVPFPNMTDLWVRFMFRNGSDEDAPMISYSLFGHPNQEVDMSWSDFTRGIDGIDLDGVEDWCSTCQTTNLFCAAIDENVTKYTLMPPENRRNKITPTIAGVIGATATLGLFILMSFVLCMLGFRIDHREKNKTASNNGDVKSLRRSGGFKGPEKLASDTDLTVQGNAGASVVRHERVGSWELNDSPKSQSPGGHSNLDKEIESGRHMSGADYSRNSEDGIGNVNPFGDPVKPLDQV